MSEPNTVVNDPHHAALPLVISEPLNRTKPRVLD
jgi:hypothetical protein